MHRRYAEGPTIRKVLQSLWYQLNNGQEIYVIGSILEDGTVKGGTGWGAEFAKLCNKPLSVFDQDRDAWFHWNGAAWVQLDASTKPVISHLHFTGTGTRTLRDNTQRGDRRLVSPVVRPDPIKGSPLFIDCPQATSAEKAKPAAPAVQRFVLDAGRPRSRRDVSLQLVDEELLLM